jgi:hypothetical protein
MSAASGSARIHYAPGEDRGVEDYYAFVVFDPEGLRIEVFCAKPPQ